MTTIFLVPVRSAARRFAWLSAALFYGTSVAAFDAGIEDPSELPRIVSLAPHLTELAFDAGIGDHLVGAVEWSDHPAGAAALPRIGDAFRFDLERILQLGATHALAWAGGTPPDAIAELISLGLDVVVVEIVTLDDIGAAIERLGALGGNPDAAAAAARSFRSRLSELMARHETGLQIVPIFYQVSERPLFTLGSKHVINEVLALCGAVNVFGDLNTEAASVDLEAVLGRDPMAIVIGSDGAGNHDARWAAFSDLRAVACGNILEVDPALLVRPTPRVLEGAETLCTWLDTRVRGAEDPACPIAAD